MKKLKTYCAVRKPFKNVIFTAKTLTEAKKRFPGYPIVAVTPQTACIVFN